MKRETAKRIDERRPGADKVGAAALVRAAMHREQARCDDLLVWAIALLVSYLERE